MARIRIERESHDLYRRLAREDDSIDGGEAPFATMKDVFLLCVVLGANRGVRTPLTAPRDIFDEAILKQNDLTILRAVALSEKNALDSLSDDSETFKIAQEFANTGVRILRDGLESKEPIQSISHLILAGR